MEMRVDTVYTGSREETLQVDLAAESNLGDMLDLDWACNLVAVGCLNAPVDLVVHREQRNSHSEVSVLMAVRSRIYCRCDLGRRLQEN